VGQFVLTIPEIIWELSLGIYLTVKGFKPGAPIIASDTQSKRAPQVPALLT